MKSLAAFGFNENNIKTIPNKSHLIVKNLAFIPCINIGTAGYYDFLKFNEIGQKLVSHFQENLKTNFGERIYISRNRPDKDVLRKVTNEQELVSMLAKYGFKTVYMEKFSFLEQISISSNAKFIIASHGAGITNTMFAKKNCHLLELVNEKWTEKTCFALMAQRANIAYNRINCLQSDNEIIEIGNISADVAELEEKLIKVLR
jgi:capsular polysaccharide biosynthesis protein